MTGTSRRLWMVGVLAAFARVAAAEPSAEQRIRMLEEQLRKTQQQIQELKAMMEQQKAIGQATQKQVNDANEQAKTAAEAAKKTASLEIPEWAKRTSVEGCTCAAAAMLAAVPNAISSGCSSAYLPT